MLLIALLLGLFPLSQDLVDAEALEWFRKGEALIDTQEAFSARQADYFERAIRIQPDFAAARYNLALIYLRQDQYSSALEQLNALIELEPQVVRGYLLRCQVLIRNNQLAGARLDAEKALTLAPEDASGWHFRGRIELADKNYDEAVPALEKALQLDPETVEIHFDLGMALHNLGRLDQAVDQYRSFLETYPDDFDAHFLLGDIYQRQDRTELALQHFLAAEQQRPEDAELNRRLAYLYLADENIEQAEKRLRAIEGGSVVDLANLGIIAAEEGRNLDAELYFRRALLKDPANGALWAHLGDLFFDRQESSAIQAYEKALSLGWDDFDILLSLGTLYANRKKNETAADYLRKALAKKPESGRAHYHLGIVLDQLGETGQAPQHYLAALAGGINQPWTHYRLTLFFAARSEAESALKHLEKALELDAEKYLPLIDRELRKVRSDLDSIRYTPDFAAVLERFRTSAPPLR